MSQHYSDPSRESDPHALPDVEVFYIGRMTPHYDENGESLERGWYYWFCSPGCLPDSDPMGPYETETKAIEAMREDCW